LRGEKDRREKGGEEGGEQSSHFSPSSSFHFSAEITRAIKRGEGGKNKRSWTGKNVGPFLPSLIPV